MNKGKLIVFSAPSGSGKTTLVQYLLNEKLNLAFSISATSRQPRENEKNGKDYFFLSNEDFIIKINDGKFLEYEEVYDGTFYGTLKDEVEKNWQNGKHVIFDIDVVGGINIKKLFPERTLAIFVKPPSIKVLEERLTNRGGNSQEDIKKRVQKAIKEMEYSSDFDKIILNDELEESKKELREIKSTPLATPETGYNYLQSNYLHFLNETKTENKISQLSSEIDDIESTNKILSKQLLGPEEKKETIKLELSELDEVIKAAKELPGYYQKSVNALDAFNLAGDFQQKFGELSTQANPKQWLRNMFDHHKKIQRTKGKIGKRLWFDFRKCIKKNFTIVNKRSRSNFSSNRRCFT